MNDLLVLLLVGFPLWAPLAFVLIALAAGKTNRPRPA